MKPIKFKDYNSEFAKDQKQYNALPALKIEGPEGHVITCWKLTFKERVRVLLLGVVWLDLLTFNKPLTPIYMSTKRKDIYSRENDKN